MASTGSSSSTQAARAPGTADVVIALATCNSERTIRAVIDAARADFARAFSGRHATFVLVDAGSTDGTRERVADLVAAGDLVELDFARPAAGLADGPYHGFPGRAAALRAVLEETVGRQAAACAILDGGLVRPDPGHIERLLAPVLEGGFDRASPYYTRHRYDGALTKGIVYPTLRALYGAAIRQPLGSEFCCSAALAGHYLQQEFWEVEHASTGVDMWLVSAAVCGGFKLCEVAFGVRPAVAREQPADLSTTVSQVVGALFADIEMRSDVWQRVRGTVAVPVIGRATDEAPEVTPPHLERLVEAYRLGCQELRDVWTWVLPPATLVELRKLADAAPDRFRFDDDLWAGVVYDYAFGYSQRVLPREHLLRSLTPLYAGWLASFGGVVRHATSAEVDAELERTCLAFEARKRHLIARWRWPERLRR